MREVTGASGAIIGLAAIAIVVAIVVGAMAVFGFGLFQRGTANFRGGTEQIEQTRGSGSYRIQAYDQFYDRCAGIQADEQTIEQLHAESRRPATTADRKSQIAATITAVGSARAEKVADYNADARKQDTRGHFRASDLPYEIPLTYDKENPTTCAS